ncbi:UNVERIFIED_CONTAM: ALBINO3-like protein 2, chloroplastic [Sesamum radiatum]|uniref:ALBINO3-like protein 2, chloroplastic n=1 Tax=Sesamum radiatum TaxID=300843 RepID=A0AAW2PH91_SESRA
MRLLTSKILRRSRLSPPLSQFFCNYSSSSSSSHSLFGSSIQHSSIQHHHDHNRPLNYSPRCSSVLLAPPHHHCFSLSRRFSSQPNLSESDDPFLPVQALISLLDACHDATGFPWWIIISSSTVAMRLALFPLVVLQLKKLKRIGEIFPKCFFSKIIVATHTGYLRIISKDIQDLSATADTAYFDCYIQCSPGMLSILAYKWFFESDTENPVVAPTNKEKGSSGVADICILTKQGEVSAKSLSPAELVAYSVKILTDGRRDTAIGLLRLALEKDPDHARALLIMGQTLLQNKQFAEAAESLESAISKGKMEEGLLHLERIAQLEEPEGPKIKAHYYDGLFMLSRSNLASSALLNVDRKAEALKYLQMCAAYDPAYNAYFELLETDSTDFASDLASSRRDF